MKYWNTRQVAHLFGISVSLLTKALWDGRVPPPQKSPSGNFLWTAHDIHRASWVLRRRDAGDILPPESPKPPERDADPVHISEILPEVMANIVSRCGRRVQDGD